MFSIKLVGPRGLIVIAEGLRSRDAAIDAARAIAALFGRESSDYRIYRKGQWICCA